MHELIIVVRGRRREHMLLDCLFCGSCLSNINKLCTAASSAATPTVMYTWGVTPTYIPTYCTYCTSTRKRHLPRRDQFPRIRLDAEIGRSLAKLGTYPPINCPSWHSRLEAQVHHTYARYILSILPNVSSPHVVGSCLVVVHDVCA